MKKLLVAPLLLLTAACAGKTPEPRTVTQDVVVTVTASCVPEKYDRKRPDYVDNDEALKKAADPAERYQLLWGGRSQRAAREAENEAVISGCSTGSAK